VHAHTLETKNTMVFRLVLLLTWCCFAHGWLWSSASPSDVDLALEKTIQQQLLDMPEAEQADVDTFGNGNGNYALGVAPSLQEKYKAEYFTCDDGRKRIPRAQVNDDYCDCQDSSDEPGTSACAGKVGARFYCVNFGYRSLYIPASKVGDGICDCCDGSDEVNNAHGITCENRCDEVGKQYREEQARLNEQRGEGIKIRQDYIRRGKLALNTGSGRKAKLNDELNALSPSLSDLENEMRQLEEKDSCAKETSSSELFEQRVDALSLNSLDVTQLQKLIIKLAVELEGGEHLAGLVADELKGSETSTTEEASSDKEQQQQKSEEGETDSSVFWVPDIEEGTNEESEELMNVRSKLEELEGQKQELEEKLKGIDDEANLDFGVEKEYWAIKDECYKAKADQYTYEICMYDKATQDSVSLGKWDGFHEDYSVIKFTNGDKCWNGPKRSLTLKVECGAEELLHSITEPSTCEYSAKFATPAACQEFSSGDI